MVGKGRVGSAIAEMGTQDVSQSNAFRAVCATLRRRMPLHSGLLIANGPMFMYTLQVLIGRGEQIPENPAGPVIVCTRNDDLNGVIESTPSGRRKGL